MPHRSTPWLVKHGHACRGAHSPEYDTWIAMVMRCVNPNNPAFHNYGGRGIQVCEAWRHSFTQFLADVGRRPSPEFSIDRIDNDGHYEPGNVRWATKRQQERNSRRNRLVGDEQINDFCERRGLSIYAVRNRVSRGWPLERIGEPVRQKRGRANGSTTQAG